MPITLFRMISKNTIKLIKSLTHKKYRLQEGLFIVEGDKNVAEVLQSSYKVKQLFATSDFIISNKLFLDDIELKDEVSKDDIKKASLLINPQNSIALCKLPPDFSIPAKINDLAVYLDGIQDPGNLGTIIRICDWFGIRQLLCSLDTADEYNPKVIQASMGSFCRVKVQKILFQDASELAKKSAATVFGTYLNGNNIYTEQLPKKALLVMGNEGNGIRAEFESMIDRKLSIPKYTNHAESLNVAVATAIVCSEFKRRNDFSIQNGMKV